MASRFLTCPRGAGPTRVAILVVRGRSYELGWVWFTRNLTNSLIPSPSPPSTRCTHNHAILMTTPTFQRVIAFLDGEIKRKSYFLVDGDGVGGVDAEMELTADKEMA